MCNGGVWRAGVPEEPAGLAADGGSVRRLGQGVQAGGWGGKNGACQTVSSSSPLVLPVQH